jgi:hypothetical protein
MLEVERLDAPSQFRLFGKNLPVNQTGTFTLTNDLGDAFSYVFVTSAAGEVNSVQYVFAEADSWQVDWQVAGLNGETRLVWEGEPARLELAEQPIVLPESAPESDDVTNLERSSSTISSLEIAPLGTPVLDIANELSAPEPADAPTDVEVLEPSSPLANETSPDDTSLATETSAEEIPVEETSAEMIPTEAASTEEPSPTEVPNSEIITTETPTPEPLPVEVAPDEAEAIETPAIETPAIETPAPVVRTPPPAWLIALGRSSWYLTFAVILAIIGLRLTLLCKYWVSQSEDIEAYWREHKTVPKLARLNIMRYFNTAEKLTLLGLFIVALLLATLAHWEDGAFATSLVTALQQTSRNPWRALAGALPPQLSALVWQIALGVFFVATSIHLVGLVLPRPERAQTPKGTPLYGLFSLLIPGSALASRGYGIVLMLAWVVVGTSVLRQIYNLPDILNLGVWGGFWALGVVYGLNLILLVAHYILGRRKQTHVMQPAKA